MASQQKISRWQDKVALGQELEGSGASAGTIKATNRLLHAGASMEGGSYLSALNKIAGRGAQGGKRAQFLAQSVALKNVGSAAEVARTTGTDDVARAYQTMAESFAGTLGVDADMSSPALLDAVRRYTEGRSSDTQRLLTGLKGQETAQTNAILLGQIAPTLDETGALVEALKMLKQEESALADAQRGSIYGGFLGPAGGAAVGGAVGGRQGSLAGYQAGQAATGQGGMADLGSILKMLGLGI
jgi:hypothetical protein